MNLNPTMLAECKDVIYNDCDLPESNKEPVHLAVKNLIVLEFSYKDFLSREFGGTGSRAMPIYEIINKCGGNHVAFMEWFSGYEQPTEEAKAAGTASPWFG